MIDNETYTCQRKKIYPDRTSAMIAADRLKAKTHASVEFKPYPCSYCHNWHVGRANRSPDAAKRNRERYEHAA
jgi:hypothetical protein